MIEQPRGAMAQWIGDDRDPEIDPAPPEPTPRDEAERVDDDDRDAEARGE